MWGFGTITSLSGSEKQMLVDFSIGNSSRKKYYWKNKFCHLRDFEVDIRS